MTNLAPAMPGNTCVTVGHTDDHDMATKMKTVEQRRDAVLNLRVPGAIRAALERAARDDERSLSGMAVRLLRTQLTALGYLEKE